MAKNLVLAGIGSLTVVDDQTITEDDLGAQFFISEEHVGQNVGRSLSSTILMSAQLTFASVRKRLYLRFRS